MRYLFYLGHPAHYHLFKFVVAELEEKGHEVHIAIKSKDVLEDLLNRGNRSFCTIPEYGTKRTKAGFAMNLLIRDWHVLRLAHRIRPDLMIGTSAEIAHVGKFLRIPSLVVNEDDYDVVPWFSRLAYPYASAIVAPSVCRMGKWAHKTIHYEGYHELAYLHPDHFTPDEEVLRRLSPNGAPYFMLRFAQLTAHHDAGRTGITRDIATRLIETLLPFGHVYISAERPLEPEFESYRFPLASSDMHSALAFANFYIGDSQTMAAESAVLGTPALRFNDFVGEIGYLNELEHQFGLTYGIRTDNTVRLFEYVLNWVKNSDLKSDWQSRRNMLLNQKINVAKYFCELIEGFAGHSDTLAKFA